MQYYLKGCDNMRKLICAKDIEALILNEKKVLYIDGSEIITPSAKELAVNNGIVFTSETPAPKVESSIGNKMPSIDGFDTETLVKFFKAMMDKGFLQEMLQYLQQSKLPFTAECDDSGLKVVRGSSVKMDVFDTGNPDAKVQFQELVNKEESKMSAGFLIIEDSKFEWELTYEEIDYVIEGTLTVEINGKTYTAYPGDVLFVPSGSKVVWGSPDKAKVFYTTYPANWADLL